MHDDVAAQVARLVGALRPGGPVEHRSGLTTVPLHGPDVVVAGSAIDLPDARAVEVREARPPAPDRLVVVNHGEVPVVVRTGDLVVGGFAARAFREPAIVAAATMRGLAVEPVEPRWWPAGPNRAAGALAPPLAALLALADEGGPGPAAIARTCLWAVATPGALAEAVRPANGVPRYGWVVIGEETVLAARLWGRPRSMRTGGVPVGAVASGSVERLEPSLRRFLVDLARVAWHDTASRAGRGEIGESRARVVHDGEAIVEVGVVRPTAELPTALLRAHGDGS
jgi:hypothetical protein